MSIMFADDFKGYGTDKAYLLNGLWATAPDGVSIAADPDPSASGNVLRISSNPFGARRVFPTGALEVVGVAFRLWMTALPSNFGNRILCAMQSADTTHRLLIYLDSTGKILVSNARTEPMVSLGGTAVPVLVANAYNHIETKFTMGTVAGAIEVRVNGVSVLTLTGINAGADTAEQFILCNGEGSWDGYYKDLVVWNDLGAHNSDFLGTVSVIGMTPDSDVDLNWTPSHGTAGWSLLDNSPPVDDVDYLTATFPPPDPSVFELTDLPTNVTSVRALITQVRARKVDGGDGNLQMSLTSSGDTDDGVDHPITTAYTYYEDVFETDPHTDASWTPISADAAQLQINRTT